MNQLHIADFCTLPTAAQPMRLMEFDELFRRQVRPPRWIGPHRVEFIFANAEGLSAEVSDLVARESECCSFFDFAIDQHTEPALQEDHLVLRIGVPATRAKVLQALIERALAAVGGAGNEHRPV
jgi:hypothetical protein